MTPGTWYGTNSAHLQKLGDLPEPRRPRRLGDLPNESVRDRYRRKGQGDDALVELECSSCHHLNGVTATSVRGDGGIFAPITFERDCKGCHDGDLRMTLAADKVQYSLQPLHGLHASELEKWLASELASAVLHDQSQSPKLIDGRLDPRDRDKIEQEMKPRIDSLKKTAQEKLFGSSQGTCAKCHRVENDKVVPPKIPTVWLPKSWFDHASHRALDCSACHEDKGSKVENEITVLGVPEKQASIPNIDNCRQCHGPSSTGGVGVRAGCVDCHRYHNGDHPLQGRGAAAFEPSPKRGSIKDWIEGK
jgi:hypothetical protein